MANPTELTDIQNEEAFPTQMYHGSDNIPSGFILKLYQMVNGAPDEVIAWTDGGDAFVIGSDLNRLESETLPQYFRHNRFQSLVRQLNFYSFRKINRERNVWIYKHELFHRDRPEDLHLVRRRTCPGLDGRKQRFSRSASRKASQGDHENGKRSPRSDDESSYEETSGDEGSTVGGIADLDRKRTYEVSESVEVPAAKRFEPSPVEEEPNEIVDTSIVNGASGDDIFNRETEEEEIPVASDKRSDRVEMIEQSMIVSEVAMKLEEYARRAMKGRGSLRTRRGGAGVVTPPYGSSHPSFASSRGLLTYDDECDDEQADEKDQFGLSAVVTDGDDSLTDEDEPSACIPKELLVPAVEDLEIVNSITTRLLAATTGTGKGGQSLNSVVSSTAVAGFCMSTAPLGDPELSSKIFQLIASCDKLALEFQLYRAALHPLNQSSVTSKYAVTNQRVWQREACRSDAVRDFKTFSVNCIHKILGKNEVNDVVTVLAKGDRIALERTADIWLKSIGTTTA